jgi:hypothetical protein
MLKNIDTVNFYNYGNYSSKNYGVNTLCFTDAQNNTYYFSYSTLVAFCIEGEFHIIKNYWGTTTGKHLNWIDSDKKIREDEETFLNNYNRLVNGIY